MVDHTGLPEQALVVDVKSVDAGLRCTRVGVIVNLRRLDDRVEVTDLRSNVVPDLRSIHRHGHRYVIGGCSNEDRIRRVVFKLHIEVAPRHSRFDTRLIARDVARVLANLYRFETSVEGGRPHGGRGC